MTYRPLPDYLTIKSSDIEGLGLFAIEDIPAKTLLGVSHHNIMGKFIRTPLGGFYNHSKTPNCFKVRQEKFSGGDIIWYDLYTLTQVKQGEELTVEYSFYELE